MTQHPTARPSSSGRCCPVNSAGPRPCSGPLLAKWLGWEKAASTISREGGGPQAGTGVASASVTLARGMTGMTGTMGLGLAAFLPIWTLMMAAMMFPSVAPTAALYAKTFTDSRPARIAGLMVGYLAVWAAVALPAYGLASLTGWLTGNHPGAAHALGVAVFAVCGVYQLSWLKDRCLAHCRSPLALLLHYGSYRGRFRDLRVGAHHGGYCLGCCWGLMVILIAVGTMNILAMVGLSVPL